MSRLIQARFSLSRFSSVASSRNVRFLSSESNKTDEPFKVEKATESNKRDDSFKVEEAETVNMPPPPTEKLLVLGGNGFVGSHVCKEALDRGLTVASLSRTGRSSIQDSWANNIIWHQGNLLSTDSWKDALKGVTSVVCTAFNPGFYHICYLESYCSLKHTEAEMLLPIFCCLCLTLDFTIFAIWNLTGV
uniref:NAD-dependent epimerase/dehydratase domain-containing protein n=1 Tax=Nicotiana tabacum TaxID=4097 RepID=A0A1S4CWD4_TOBAC|nr:PREDICTED: uncharacterized protein LOC107823340 [Nicotiana tabacum]